MARRTSFINITRMVSLLAMRYIISRYIMWIFSLFLRDLSNLDGVGGLDGHLGWCPPLIEGPQHALWSEITRKTLSSPNSILPGPFLVGIQAYMRLEIWVSQASSFLSKSSGAV